MFTQNQGPWPSSRLGNVPEVASETLVHTRCVEVVGGHQEDGGDGHEAEQDQ